MIIKTVNTKCPLEIFSSTSLEIEKLYFNTYVDLVFRLFMVQDADIRCKTRRSYLQSSFCLCVSNSFPLIGNNTQMTRSETPFGVSSFKNFLKKSHLIMRVEYLLICKRLFNLLNRS